MNVVPEWVFDPVPPSGALSGGDPASYVFKPDLDTLVREVIQNSNDQRAGDAPVDVTFTLEEFGDQARQAFLDGLGWASFAEHLDAVASSRSLINGRVGDALEGLAQGRLFVLRIDDYGTRGLTGPEDGTSGNFVALCKHVLVTTDDKAVRGGSHGLGKAVLWRFSSFSTVLFSSRYGGGADDHLRVFGRAELPFHDTAEERWAGPGWFGLPEQTSHGRRAVSVPGAQAEQVMAQLGLARPVEAGTGTSVAVLGFSEPGSEVARPLPDIARDIVAAAERWFWPRLLEGSLTVRVRAVTEGAALFDEVAAPVATSPFVRVFSAAANAPVAGAPDQLAERELSIRIPARKGAATADTQARVLLRVLRVDEDAPPQDENSVALIRGAGMVVRYWRPPGHLPLAGGGFRAVLLAGTMRGDEASDLDVEEFLRAAEPPAHDDWVHHTNAVSSRYRIGAKARLDELFLKIRQALLELCAAAPRPSEQGPELLARHFRLGSKGTRTAGGGQKFVVDFGTPRLAEAGWHIEGSVRRRRGERPWRVDVQAMLEGETGLTAPLAVSEFSFSGDGVRGALSQGSLARFDVPEGTDWLTFNLVARARPEDADLLRRSRLRVDAKPMETAV